MSLILNIDTSTEQASICLSDGGRPVYSMANAHQKDHASWIHVAIQEALKATGSGVENLEAVAITAGPGSYTGLRVGMASAKGLCYALGIPLIAINTLEAMAFAVREEDADFLCPMIDARRMEVFAALYDKEMNILISPAAMILEEGFFAEYLDKGQVLFFGNGSKKFAALTAHAGALYAEKVFHAADLAVLAHQKWMAQDFTELAYSEPVYIKDFYMPGFGT